VNVVLAAVAVVAFVAELVGVEQCVVVEQVYAVVAAAVALEPVGGLTFVVAAVEVDIAVDYFSVAV